MIQDKLFYKVLRKIKLLVLHLFYVFFVLKYVSNKSGAIKALILRRNVVLFLKNGIKIVSNANVRTVLIIFEIFIRKNYNPKGFEIGKNDLVVDIGGNTGVFSLLAASITHNKVYSCEPFKKNIELIEKNVKGNKFKNIKIIPYAISDKNSFVNLYLSSICEGHSLYNKCKREEWEFSEKVKTIILKDLIDKNKIAAIDFLKMDCEGSEGAILLSTPKKYLRKIKKIAMEYHDDSSIIDHKKIIKLLKDVGFKVYFKKDTSKWGYIYAKR